MRSLLLLIVSLLCVCSWGQNLRVGFYNVENLFDTINQANVDDGDFTPQGRKRWSAAKYEAKITKLTRAIELFAPDVLGVCEVENYGVVSDVARRSSRLKGVVHYDSRDSRGIDVALIYDTAKLRVLSSEPIFVAPMRRNFLRVELLYNKSTLLTVFVVHLPSKLGGAGAATRRSNALIALDSLARDTDRVIIVGDFNDSPREVGRMFNCAIKPFTQGQGSYAYRDVWDMIDQIVVSRDLLPYIRGVQRVVRDSSLLHHSGRYAGYPIKGSISDHLPVFIDISVATSTP